MVDLELEHYRKSALKIAKSLTYPTSTIRKIEQAISITNISNIMKQARLDSCEEYRKKQAKRKNNKYYNEN